MSDEIAAMLNDPVKFAEIARAAFDATDVDGTGHIDRDELEGAMKQISTDIGIPEPTKEDVDEIFKSLDTDNSGKIDFNEFKVFVRKLFEAMLE
jgi:Ca2+-binding EF-hand superfamily protein